MLSSRVRLGLHTWSGVHILLIQDADSVCYAVTQVPEWDLEGHDFKQLNI